MSETNKSSVGITSVLQETRVFPPPKEFSKRAHIKSLVHYRRLHSESIKAPERFWGRMAKQELVWFKPFKKVLHWKEPFAKWFIGGRLNLSYNCLDKWLGTPTANKAALIWEGEPAAPGKQG
ncbi:MAG TPA: acetyl-coenzyme A synthetase N-terminal domain-containing protein, partial [Candidatus Eisenbacteria bacterium]|nr:acetyl-coenzyme A synthetase N-terminal domain-containing protein [Candidatus Eisenbacteria bacterium]